MDQFAALTGRQYQPFEYVGDPDAERVIVIMGSGCETAHETVEYLNERGAKARRAQGAPVPPVRACTASSRRCRPASRPSPCWTAPRNPAPWANRSTWTSWPASTKASPPAGASSVHAQGPGRTLRALLQGVHAGHGQGRLRQPGRRHPEEPLHRGHRGRRHPHQPGVRPGVLDRVGQGRARAVLRAGLRRHGRRQQELDQDHRREHRQLRAGLLRL